MSKRTIEIQNPCKLSIKNEQLVIALKEAESSVPLEDIWVIILESQHATVTSAALSKIADNGIGVITCDGTHHPNGLFLPIGAHSRHAEIVKHQLSISKPLQKRLWQKIVVQKITNQYLCLKYLNDDIDDTLLKIARSVQSGDTNNKEAHAAEIYFKKYLPDGTRRASTLTAALDYGYAIMRAGIARAAVSYGWLVSRGIHHDNENNAFNLVDDLIEPFRPVVDFMIAKQPPQDGLTPTYKRYLASLHEQVVLLDGREFIVQTATNIMLESLKRAVVNKESDLLLLPSLTNKSTNGR